MGRSRGGFSGKIHLAAEGLGNPLRLALTAGQCHDITQAQALMDGFDKLASRYLGFLHFVGALIWLR